MEPSKDPSVVQLQTEFLHMKKELKSINDKVDKLIETQDRLSKQGAMGAFALKLVIGIGAFITWTAGVAIAVKHLFLN